MEKTDCFYLGKIIKPFSYKGELVAFFDVDNPLEYAELDGVFVEIGNKLVMYQIANIRINNNKAVFRFKDTTVEDSEGLIGKDLYLPLELLPKLDGTKFYYHEVIGFDVEDTKFGNVGNITEIIDNSPQALFCINHNGKEVLIPIIDQIIKNVDREQKKILISAPEGLIDIYLE
ncbi:MAG: ribosome maturation factor RimM [Bacteroidales bacterium]|jgi:16S rRNA processing protein RimM|nr:ribosome maturation factor RimM [Bacteroidales bacterium]